MAKIVKGKTNLNGGDVTEFLQNGGKIDDEKVSKINILYGLDIFNATYDPVEWVIQDLFPMRAKTIAVGDFEAGKSYFTLGAALSIASGKTEYLGFTIKKQRKVLYVDLENGHQETIKRVHKLSKGHGIDIEMCRDTFGLLTKPGDFEDVFPMIEAQVEVFCPDVIIIDNLYQLSGSSNIADADKIKPLLTRIENLRSQKESAIILVHHFNKNTQEQGLTEERMAGSSVINWWYEHCVMIGKTNESFSALGIGKSRLENKNRGTYAIEIADTHDNGIMMQKRFLIKPESVATLMMSKARKIKWESHLERMPNIFQTHEWLNVCNDKHGESVADSTAHRWLNDMVDYGMLEKMSHGRYKKTNAEFYVESN